MPLIANVVKPHPFYDRTPEAVSRGGPASREERDSFLCLVKRLNHEFVPATKRRRKKLATKRHKRHKEEFLLKLSVSIHVEGKIGSGK